MKKLCAAAIAVVSFFSSYGQTLYIPSGTSGIGSSTTGNVGIGTSSPQEALHINGNLRGSVNGAVRISTGYGTMDIGAQNSSYAHFYTNMPAFFFGNPIVVAGPISSHTSYDLNLQTAGTTRMTISNASGNVGINATSPGAALDIKSNSSPYPHLYLTTSRTFASSRNWGIATNWASEGDFSILESTTNANSPSVFRFYIDGNGNIGAGTTVPSFRLHVRSGNANSDLMTLGSTTTGSLALTSADGGAYGLFAGVSNTGRAWLQGGRYDSNTAYDISLQAAGGNVGIGTTNPDYKLTVNGSVHAKEVRVDLSVPGPDYVFEKDYKLASLDEIKNYIDQNKHLPEVPSAKEMEKNGVQLGEMNMMLLKKIEELTLHMITLKNENEEMKKENSEFRQQLKSFQENIEKSKEK